MKFKIDDKVRCIKSTGLKGMGWKECLEFTIDHFRPADSLCCAVYFPKNGHGVYEEALELVEEKQNKMEITRKQLKSIHDVACFAWQNKIEDYSTRNPWGDTIEFTQTEIDEMFGAATASQKEVLEAIFGKQRGELDLRSDDINLKVDGLPVFGRSCDSSRESLIGLPLAEYAKNSFYLNKNYEWVLKGNKLTVTRK